MELQDKPLDPQESLQLIQRFISGTRENFRRTAFGFIFWGILITVAALANYFLLLIIPDLAWIPWPVLTIGGSIITFFYYAVYTKKSGVVSSRGTMFKWLFLCGGLTYFLFIYSCAELKISPTPFMLGLTWLLIVVAGLIIQFKPMVWGGILFFLATIVSVFISPANQLLLTAGAFLIGYLLPGILLVRKKEE